MSNPQITVLMSVFNGSDYLPVAVESILNQSFTDFEFLIIDDGSSEPVIDDILSYGDDRIRTIRQENMGLTKSLNTGISLARGEYVARMDADDISLPDRLKNQFKVISRSKRLDLVGTFFEIIDEKGNLVQKKELIIDPVYRLWRLQFHNNYGHGSMVFRKSSIIKVGMYDSRLRFAQDFDLWSRISKKDNTHIIPEFLYGYRMNTKGEQASVKNYDDQLQAAICISDRNLKGCNPILDDQDLIDLRSLYWEFQLPKVSPRAPVLARETLETFCLKYDVDTDERKCLEEFISKDVAAAIR
ncbi:MAG: glycosyltransferase [Deltaproteobacteria bacterium]|nr:glycosyltransferase [Deltaproteobacteria bacterium]